MNIEQVDINKIKPYEKNSRVHNDSHIKQVCKSIEEFGFVNPILVDKRFTIIAGHGRYMAAKKLGFEKVPCIKINHFSEEQRKAYVIADNKLSLNSSWNTEMLLQEMSDLKDMGFDLDITGFSSIELMPVLEDNVVDNPMAEWDDMPEYEQDNLMPHRTIYVHFRNEEDVHAFFKIMHQSFTPQTKTIWHPKLVIMENKNKRYE